MGTWLQKLGIPASCQVCPMGLVESPQHYLLLCEKVDLAWYAFRRIWQAWGALEVITNWNFILLNEIAIKSKEFQPLAHNFKTRFYYTKQPLDLLCSFHVYFLWTDRCRKNFEDTYSSFKIFRQAWVSIVEAGMAAWKDLSSTRTHETLEAKANLAFIRADFIFTWCFLDCSLAGMGPWNGLSSPLCTTLTLCLWCDAVVCCLPSFLWVLLLVRRKCKARLMLRSLPFPLHSTHANEARLNEHLSTHDVGWMMCEHETLLHCIHVP